MTTPSPSKKCSYCGNPLPEGFALNVEEVAYIVANIQHEYLAKETYYFASELFGRMERFSAKHRDELARRDSKTT